MDYNTQRGDIEYREYGRVMERIVERVCKLEKPEERIEAARATIETMSRVSEPGPRDEVSRHKMWDHLMVMSDFSLADTWPYSDVELEALRLRTAHKNDRPKERLPYSSRKIEHRHYGAWLEKMAHKLKEVEDGPAYDELALQVARQAKRSYLVWNGDVTNDNMIVDQVAEMSGDERVQQRLHDQPVVVPFNSLPLEEASKKKKKKRKK
ncbi:MAG: DUF4290 domain-containing protein [Bacteroidales bacterium]|nr:DUF4290 domain-containing protein [Bacteroidales bacterium]